MKKLVIPLLAGLFFTIGATASGVDYCSIAFKEALRVHCNEQNKCPNGCDISYCTLTVSDSSACTGTCQHLDQGLVYAVKYSCT